MKSFFYHAVNQTMKQKIQCQMNIETENPRLYDVRIQKKNELTML